MTSLFEVMQESVRLSLFGNLLEIFPFSNIRSISHLFAENKSRIIFDKCYLGHDLEFATLLAFLV